MMDGKSDTDQVDGISNTVHPGCLQAIGSVLCGLDW